MNSVNKPNDERGFIHKKILGIGTGVISGFLGGGPLGAIGGGLSAFSGRSRAQVQPPPPRKVPGFGGLVERFIPGGRSGFFPELPGAVGPGGVAGLLGAQGGVTGAAALSPNGTCPAPVMGGNRRVNAAGEVACPGFHWNESTYTRLGGPCSNKPAGLVVKGTEQVKNRRNFNTANGPARKRAIKRLKAGEKDCKEALRALGFRTISKQSSREMRMRRRGHR